jgi:hypothetical protein
VVAPARLNLALAFSPGRSLGGPQFSLKKSIFEAKQKCSGSRSVDRCQIDHCKSLSACCIGKTVIERNYFERWRPTLCGDESRRQLQRIGSTQQVNTKKPYRCLSDSITRVNLVAGVGELL